MFRLRLCCDAQPCNDGAGANGTPGAHGTRGARGTPSARGTPGSPQPLIRRRALPGAVFALLSTSLALLSTSLAAETLTVAVASNFLAPFRALESEFERASGHELTAVPGSTGQLYAQIVNGAPFDVFLAADQKRPQRLVNEGRAERDSLFTYAVGQLALWTRDPRLGAGLSLETLRRDDYRWLAIAQPEVAPYGAAALQVLRATSLLEALDGRIVYGQNITHAFTMAETGNADLALIAMSQAVAYEGTATHVVVPPELYDALRQDAVLLSRAASSSAAAEFLEFLKSPEATQIIERFGYRALPE